LAGLDHERPTILRLRALTRLGRLQEAREVVLEAALADAGELERAEFNVAYANLAMKLRRHDIAEAFADAERSLAETRAQTLQAEFDFIRARHAWASGELNAADRYAEQSAAPGDDDRTAVPHLQHVRAFAIDLQGLLAQEREQFDLAAVRFREALDVYEMAAVPDDWVPAYSTANLAILARDFASATSSADLERRIERVRWSIGTAAQRFISLHGLGWARVHEGNHLGALRTFHAAADMAPSSAFKVMAWVDHANLGRAIGAGLGATESALYAADEAETVRWEEVGDNERIVLLFVAGSTAALDPARARHLLRRYEATHRSDDPTPGIVSSDNVLWRCFELRAEATVLRAEGFTARAATLLREEYEHWRRIGSETRAAIAQRDLREIGALAELSRP
jgi:tetratricopeptide (TPR) repeat protein